VWRPLKRSEEGKTQKCLKKIICKFMVTVKNIISQI